MSATLLTSAREYVRTSSRGFDFSLNFQKLLAGAADQENFGAGPRVGDGEGAADAVACSGDDRKATIEAEGRQLAGIRVR